MTTYEIILISTAITVFTIGMIFFIRYLNEEARVERLTARRTFHIK